MATETRGEFTAGFKREAVALLQGGGRPLTRVAAALGIQPSMLRHWGSPRMHAALRAEGHRCSRGRVERLMRRHHIRARAGRRFRPCATDNRHLLAVAPNFLARRFKAVAPDRVWLADLTSIPTDEGWLYLAAILDLATRKVVGWAMRGHMRVALTLSALLMAVQRQRPPTGLPAVRRGILDRLFIHLVVPVRCPHCQLRFLSPAPKLPKLCYSAVIAGP